MIITYLRIATFIWLPKFYVSCFRQQITLTYNTYLTFTDDAASIVPMPPVLISPEYWSFYASEALQPVLTAPLHLLQSKASFSQSLLFKSSFFKFSFTATTHLFHRLMLWSLTRVELTIKKTIWQIHIFHSNNMFSSSHLNQDNMLFCHAQNVCI